MNFIVYKLYLSKHNFKKYISPSTPTIFWMGTLSSHDLLQQTVVGNRGFSAPALRPKWAGSLASYLRPQHVLGSPGVLTPEFSAALRVTFKNSLSTVLLTWNLAGGLLIREEKKVNLYLARIQEYVTPIINLYVHIPFHLFGKAGKMAKQDTDVFGIMP